ncbi:hypothetical protein FGG08_004647 [Glutinoglossum americanum]|uniref:Glutathione S-transferase kappa n=1 Tax=Glutinoglossum americanum TaxID=1670608 RepID=A0A9P8I1V5_9PEZI|nr:hypothetical protein FGG08_004647 [Glutinoglossum americanum]
MAKAKGKIDVFVDCVSPYSYYAVKYLLKNRAALQSYGVEVEFHPVFLGAIMTSSVIPAKAKYMGYDTERAKKYFNIPNLRLPENFPILTLLPQRCLTYIKQHYPSTTYESTFVHLWIQAYELSADISKPPVLARALASTSLFSPQEVERILAAAGEPKYKEMLMAATKRAIDQGAFGAPWFWVRNGEGKEEPFFGSDRWAFMWRFLGVPFRDVEIVEKGKL